MDDDFRRRRLLREREDQRDKDERGSIDTSEITGRSIPIEKLNEFFDRAEPLIEQVNNLYNLYVMGVESAPPRERRQQLDQLIVTLQAVGKPTPAYRYRFDTLQATYNSNKERWEKLMRDIESGKIKPPARGRRPKRS